MLFKADIKSFSWCRASWLGTLRCHLQGMWNNAAQCVIGNPFSFSKEEICSCAQRKFKTPPCQQRELAVEITQLLPLEVRWRDKPSASGTCRKKQSKQEVFPETPRDNPLKRGTNPGKYKWDTESEGPASHSSHGIFSSQSLQLKNKVWIHSAWVQSPALTFDELWPWMPVSAKVPAGIRKRVSKGFAERNF